MEDYFAELLGKGYRKMPKISVLMNTYKEDVQLIQESIESILNQTYKEFEFIIILDNVDNEEHKKIIKEYEQKDSRIVFKVNSLNPGRVGALNYGLSLCQGDFIAIMDADDISYPNRLELQLDYMNNHDIDLIGGAVQVIDENGEKMYGIGKIPETSDKINKLSKYSNCVAHPTWLGKREVFEKNQGYRDIKTCEDYDFELRAMLNGFKLGNLNQVVLEYRMTKKSISRSNLYEQYLYLKYLSKSFAKKEVADIGMCEKYVRQNNVERKSKAYLKANQNFNSMMQSIHEKKYLCFIVYGFRTLFSSKDYMNKIYRLFRLSINH